MIVPVPISTQCLILGAVATASISGVLPYETLLPVAVYASCLGLAVAANNDAKLDNPAPVRVCLHPPAVWAQIDQVLRTGRRNWKDAAIFIDYSNPEPAPDQPILVQATITIQHPHLKQRRIRGFLADVLPPDRQELQSRIVLRATVQEAETGTSELKMCWQTEPLFGRSLENAIIKDLTSQVFELIEAHISSKG